MARKNDEAAIESLARQHEEAIIFLARNMSRQSLFAVSAKSLDMFLKGFKNKLIVF